MVRKRIQIREAADFLGVSPRMTQQLCARGELAAIKVGSIWTTTPADVEAYLARQKATQEARRQSSMRQFRERLPAPVAPPSRALHSSNEQYYQALYGDLKRRRKQK